MMTTMMTILTKIVLVILWSFQRLGARWLCRLLHSCSYSQCRLLQGFYDEKPEQAERCASGSNALES